MTPDDIINKLNPDTIKCLITHEWIKPNDNYQYFNSSLSRINWQCIKHCPKFLHHQNNIFK